MSDSDGRDPIAFSPNGRRRARGLGLPLRGTTGPLNAITDVPGVTVGMTTLISGDGEKAVRTGVTAVLPRPPDALLHPCWAGTFAMNGNGELTGCHWIREAGWFTGPITVTNTCSLGLAHHGTVRWLAHRFPDVIGEGVWPLPVVGETYDGWLNDIAGLHLDESHVLAAIDSAAGGPVAEGSVGGGTGMIAYEFKGGTGTASRRVETGAGTYTLGVLVQANHGVRPWLTVAGVAVGRLMPEGRFRSTESGSIIVVLATDAPLIPTQIERLARRIGIGMGRGGTPSGNDSGDIYLAFSTANDPGQVPLGPTVGFTSLGDQEMDALFMATVDSVEEAILNAMLAAETMTGRRGRVVQAIDPQRLRDLVCAKP
ncbi:DmpA family aminopeptidase [Phreatobacter sp. AB_2022a]|uniref:DmpA family aminopeptidase n=1 Tax=Phreatobacter sp. AB_2022a TaxID=3003134 RepID=UPI002286D8B4|nr:P1 family peptidase [Phreatobacter sp. AB_2022a]MCZ0735261.1 P1 family peptidase [Phreatobacter sp. AB_2022a]